MSDRIAVRVNRRDIDRASRPSTVQRAAASRLPPASGIDFIDRAIASAVHPGRPLVSHPAAAQPVVQRKVEWKKDNHPDANLDKFAKLLDDEVQNGAKAALTPDVLVGTDGYTARWKDTAPLIMAFRDNAITTDQEAAGAKIAARFGPARYGYAVEAYVNAKNGALQAALPAKHTVGAQVGRGMTRPDFIVSANGADVGWFDITSEGSVGHIDKKTGSGWQSKPYVAEVTYPAFSTYDLALSDQSIGAKVSIRHAAARVTRSWNRQVEKFRSRFIESYDLQAGPDAENASLANRKLWAANALQDVFDGTVKGRLAKSVLRALGLLPAKYGMGAGGSKAEGDMLLQEYID